MIPRQSARTEVRADALDGASDAAPRGGWRPMRGTSWWPGVRAGRPGVRAAPLLEMLAVVAALALLTALPARAADAPPPSPQAPPAKTDNENPTGSLPDRPGAYSVSRAPMDPVALAAKNLPAVSVSLSGGRSFDRDAPDALVTVLSDSVDVLGRVEFVRESAGGQAQPHDGIAPTPEPKARENAAPATATDPATTAAAAATSATAARVVFLHGQPEETLRLPPGRYRIALSFWLAGQAFPRPFPTNPAVDLARGQKARLEMTRQDNAAIRKWLEALEAERTRKSKNPRR
jgi:hypothetical protein